MPGFFFTKGLEYLELAQTALTEFGRTRTAPDPDTYSSALTQLSDRLKSLHGEMSEKGEGSTDWGEVDTKLLSLIGEGVEQFVQQTGQNMDMSPDTSVPES